ncbi:lipoprotein-anchoring transpeptidase ErfK/SrfK [Nonomuraea polychroma]|uniref:Lipoprotein-anchoring transpeptidase ErfK/SrfK n=1 Tax=Nonomuraea polychroma TaxID=46176 RepID=A0A438M114_9ACTN|nr:Ig-like domain-containing protein [Nonomuraea polychroma]RVX39341.1 lipoprotein-anchoring transpeptidase ErfK/SrfK [Nonomuraea polychroma]
MQRVTYVSAGLLALALLTACSAKEPAPEGIAMAGGARGPAVSFSPQDKTKDVPTDQPVVVSATSGKLRSVRVAGSKSAPLEGELSADGTRWRSLGTARPGTEYTVTAVSVDAAGKQTTTTSTFATVKGKETFDIETITPNKEYTGLTVGVGMPIMIAFDKPIKDRVSVERNLIVRSSKPVEGAWHWFDDQHVDFRPQKYWPAHTRVRVEARLAGVRGGPGMYGKRDVTLNFKIGRSQITKGSTDEHVLIVRRDGKKIRTMPMSAGKGGVWKYYTTSGIHLAMSREPVTVMTSPGIGPGQPGYYQLTVYNTVRISNSGEYVHSAPWSVGSQGSANVSHGCVNISPDNARWFIKNTLIGDPIIITGSPRKLEPTNGWGHWQENWKQWLKWSSLKAGPTIALS